MIVGLIISILSLILAVPLAVAANILTPKFQNWLAKFSHKRSAERVEQLEANLQRLTFLSQRKQDLILRTLKAILEFLMLNFFLFVIGVISYIIFYFADMPPLLFYFLIGALIFQFIIYEFAVVKPFEGLAKDLSALSDFEEYTKKTKEQIEKLLPEKVNVTENDSISK